MKAHAAQRKPEADVEIADEHPNGVLEKLTRDKRGWQAHYDAFKSSSSVVPTVR
jgi:outer membrane biogenesis lipoprotein LolB